MPSQFCATGAPDTALKCNVFINLEEIEYIAWLPLSFSDTTLTAANVNLTATWSGIVTNTDLSQKGYITPKLFSYVATAAEPTDETSESGVIEATPRQNGVVNVMWTKLDRVSHVRLLRLRPLGAFKFVLFNKDGQMFANQKLDYPAYDAATAYNIGDQVFFSDRTWESLTAANTGNDPVTDSTNWVEIFEPVAFRSSTIFDVGGDRGTAGNTANDKISGKFNFKDSATANINVWDASTPFNELFGVAE